MSLCKTCRHVRSITSGRGSTFLLCQLASGSDGQPASQFVKYPPQPVMRCVGFERFESSDVADSD